MRKQKFTVIEALSFGWNTFIKNWLFIMASIFVFILACIIIISLRKLLIVRSSIVLGIVSMIYMVVQAILGMGIIKVALKLYDNDKRNLKDLFCGFYSGYFFAFSYVAGCVLFSLIFFGGSILLFIPAIVWAIKFHFFAYIIVDKNVNPIIALKRSSEITKGSRWQLLLFYIVVMAVNVSSWIFIVLAGLFRDIGVVSVLTRACFVMYNVIVIPISILAVTFVYRKLSITGTETVEQ